MLLFATPFWGAESGSSSWMEPVKTSRKMAAALLLFAFFDSFVHRESNYHPRPFPVLKKLFFVHDDLRLNSLLFSSIV